MSSLSLGTLPVAKVEGSKRELEELHSRFAWVRPAGPPHIPPIRSNPMAPHKSRGDGRCSLHGCPQGKENWVWESLSSPDTNVKELQESL